MRMAFQSGDFMYLKTDLLQHAVDSSGSGLAVRPAVGATLGVAGVFFVLLSGCATDEAVEPDSAELHLRFDAPANGGEFITVYANDTLHWHIDEALLSAGEIGIHWSRKLAKQGVAEPGVAARVSHDVPGGKPSPKVYEYHAVDLLRGTPIQTLTVGPALYDHVHMIWQKADDRTRGIDSLGALQTHALWVSGKVSLGDSTRDFTLAIDTTYQENDLGDVLFDLEVRNGESFEMSLSAQLGSWFNDVLWGELKPIRGDTADIRFDNDNRNAARKIEKRYKLDNAFAIDVKKRSE
jgi:hypothetical protein